MTCPNGRLEDGTAHDFTLDPIGGALLYCRRCGEVRPLQLAPSERQYPPLPPPNPALMGKQA